MFSPPITALQTNRKIPMTNDSNVKVLVAEDDAVSRKLLEAALQKEGYEVVSVSSGNMAWEAFNETPFRMVVSDWSMPGMDGLELCRLIRRRPKTPYAYFILLTGVEASRENFRKAIDWGVDDFIGKPIKQDLIWARLHVAQRILQYTWQIGQLQGLLPICMYCKKIRQEDEYWKQIEQYISENTGTVFSHGICPECCEKFLAQLEEDKHAPPKSLEGQ